MSLHTTPSATVGPYLAIGLTWEDGPHAVAPDTPGAIWIRGTVFDGNGDAVPDAMVETWQADPDGRFDHPDDPRGAAAYPGFRGFGRSQTVDGGEYAICTLKPGRVPDGEGGLQAPHIDVSRLRPRRSSTGSSPASTSPTRPRPTPRTSSCGRCPTTPRGRR